MTERTPEKMRAALAEWRKWHPGMPLMGKRWDDTLADVLGDALAAWEADLARIEALWEHCRIIYYLPATEATGWVQPYPIEHNIAAGKNGRDAIEAALAAIKAAGDEPSAETRRRQAAFEHNDYSID